MTVAEIGISHEPLLQDADVIHSFDREEYRRMLRKDRKILIREVMEGFL